MFQSALYRKFAWDVCIFSVVLDQIWVYLCAADFSLLNLPKGKSLGRSKPATNSEAQALQLTMRNVSTTVYPSLTELPSIDIK